MEEINESEMPTYKYRQLKIDEHELFYVSASSCLQEVIVFLAYFILVAETYD